MGNQKINQGLNEFLGEFEKYTDEQFIEFVEDHYCQESLDFSPRKWNNFVKNRVKSMWYIFVNRN